MDWINFGLGMAACAVIVGVWRVIKDSRKSEQEFKNRVYLLEDDISKHTRRLNSLDDQEGKHKHWIKELHERLERLEKRKR